MVNYSTLYSPTTPHNREGKLSFSRSMREQYHCNFFFSNFYMPGKIGQIYQQSPEAGPKSFFHLGNHTHLITVLSFSCSAGSRPLIAIYI